VKRRFRRCLIGFEATLIPHKIPLLSPFEALAQKTTLRTGCIVAATVVAESFARKSVITAVETIKHREE